MKNSVLFVLFCSYFNLKQDKQDKQDKGYIYACADAYALARSYRLVPFCLVSVTH